MTTDLERRRRKREAERRYEQKHREKHLAGRRRYREKHRAKILFDAAARRAARTGLEFTIEVDDVVVPTHCPVLGIPLSVSWGRKGGGPASPSIDRIDNSRGYVKGNVWVISKRANSIKNAGTLEELLAVTALKSALDMPPGNP